MPLAQIKE